MDVDQRRTVHIAGMQGMQTLRYAGADPALDIGAALRDG
jgi:hypothetical protein